MHWEEIPHHADFQGNDQADQVEGHALFKRGVALASPGMTKEQVVKKMGRPEKDLSDQATWHKGQIIVIFDNQTVSSVLIGTYP